jgi:hypothetical protein
MPKGPQGQKRPFQTSGGPLLSGQLWGSSWHWRSGITMSSAPGGQERATDLIPAKADGCTGTSVVNFSQAVVGDRSRV